MKRKVEKIRHILLQGLSGMLIGSIIPVFVTLSYMGNTGLAPNWANWWEVHVHNGTLLLVDVVPVLFGIMLAKISADRQELKERRQEYVQVKTELDEQLSRWKMIFDHTPVGYAVLDRELNLVFANRICGVLAGAPVEELIGKKCYDCFGSGELCDGCPVVKAFVSMESQTGSKKEVNRQGEENILEQIAVPIIKHGQVEQVIEIMVNVTEQAHSLQNRHEELIATIDTMVGIIELKDGYTGGHSQRVRRWAVRIARSLGLPEQEIIDIDIAACLHDIGKIGIAGLILNKPGDLTMTEYEMVKKHPVVGSDTLAGIPRLENVSKIIRHHHEAFGGSGYPDGLSGSEIPVGSRVICVADAYDAMTSDRVYRKAIAKDHALAEIKLGAGKQFDPRVVEAFLEVVSEHKVIQFPLAREKLS
ncbi:MAG: HD domain-containing protein [Clostridia bacterium]|nr:HD domain-containing protein [Clostridia bacterium]